MAVFINYRREDSEGDTRAIYNRLAEETDESNLFLDFEAIGAGEKWRLRIDDTLKKVGAVIVVIGPRWLDILKTRPPPEPPMPFAARSPRVSTSRVFMSFRGS